MNFSSVPNALSILRIILTVPVVMTLLNHQYFLAMVLFFVAGITDALDGWIAKRYSFESRLGSILDPVADKLLLVSSFVTLYLIGLLPLWLLVLVFLRDLMIVSGTVGCFIGAGVPKKRVAIAFEAIKDQHCIANYIGFVFGDCANTSDSRTMEYGIFYYRCYFNCSKWR